MRLKEEYGYVLDNGRVVRVSSIFDTYESYETETGVGHDAKTYVRYSHWWNDSRVIAPKTESVESFFDRVEREVPPFVLPDESGPNERIDV